MTKKGRAAPLCAIQQQTTAAPKERQPEHGMLYKHPKSGIYLCRFYGPTGKQLHLSTKTTSRDEALDFLAEKVAAVRGNTFDDPKLDKITLADLFRDVVADYKRKGQRSIQDIEIRWHKHLEGSFGGTFKVARVTTDRLIEYIERRQKEKASASSINRELALLRRMLHLGAECTPKKVRLDRIPNFGMVMLAEDNVREGFLSSADYDRLAAECSKIGLWLRAMLEVGYTLGWRREEVRPLKVSAFDQIEGTLALDSQHSKNKKARLVGLTQSLRVLLSQLAIEKEPDDPLFTRDDGSEVKSFREIWHTVCIRAGLAKMIHSCGNEVTSKGEGRRTRYDCPKCERRVFADSLTYKGLLYHDLRRSAAKAFAKARVPQYTIMDVCGWRSASMFRRYRGILDVERSHDAMRQLEQYREQVAAEIAAAKTTAKNPMRLTLSCKQDNLPETRREATRDLMN